MSQGFPAIPLNTINTPVALLHGAGFPSQFGDYRVNVGIVNVDSRNAQTFAIQLQSIASPPAPILVTVPPLSMQQVGVGFGGSNFGPTTIAVFNATDRATKSNLWVAYVSTVDNVTGDAWSELATVVESFP
jgi:hypothetical protein